MQTSAPVGVAPVTNWIPNDFRGTVSQMTLRLAAALAAGAGVALGALPAVAQTANVSVNLNAAGRNAANLLGLDVGQVEGELEQQLGALFGLRDVSEFLRLSANAQSMVNKGIGVDYASNPKGFLLGVSVSGALDAGDAELDDLANIDGDRIVPVGVGAQISLMAGFNFAMLGLPELTLFANGMAFPLQYDVYQADFRNFGVHAQYKLFKRRGGKAAGWGGLDITSGLQFSETVLNLDEQIERTVSVDGGRFLLDTEITGNLELVQTAWTVPLEITSNVRFLYVLSLYGGAGVDFQFGDAKMVADLQSPLQQSGADLGTVTIDANAASDPTRVLFRLLVGTQVHLGPIKVWGQLNFLTEDLTVGGAAGVRAVF